MQKLEFIKVLQDEISNENNIMIKRLGDCVITFLSNYPDSLNIDDDKTIKKLYKTMYDYARTNKVDGFFAYTDEQVIEIIKDYFKLENSSNFVNLEDFL